MNRADPTPVATKMNMKTRDELLELIRDSMRLDWLEMNMECGFGRDSAVGEWVWRDSDPDNRDLRKAIDAEMMPKPPAPK